MVIKSWQDNRHKPSSYFKYTADIRRIIYTTNAIEEFHQQARKVTKTKGAFSNDKALLKLIFLAYQTLVKNERYSYKIGQSRFLNWLFILKDDSI